MNVELESIIKKIRGLLAKTVANGASEEEAMSAIALAGVLLKKYNLELSQVVLDSQNCMTNVMTMDCQRRIPVLRILNSLAEFCDCKVYTSWDENKNRTIHFFGLETDTILCCVSICLNQLKMLLNERLLILKTVLFIVEQKVMTMKLFLFSLFLVVRLGV